MESQRKHEEEASRVKAPSWSFSVLNMFGRLKSDTEKPSPGAVTAKPSTSNPQTLDELFHQFSDSYRQYRTTLPAFIATLVDMFYDARRHPEEFSEGDFDKMVLLGPVWEQQGKAYEAGACDKPVSKMAWMQEIQIDASHKVVTMAVLRIVMESPEGKLARVEHMRFRKSLKAKAETSD